MSSFKLLKEEMDGFDKASFGYLVEEATGSYSLNKGSFFGGTKAKISLGGCIWVSPIPTSVEEVKFYNESARRACGITKHLS